MKQFSETRIFFPTFFGLEMHVSFSLCLSFGLCDLSFLSVYFLSVCNLSNWLSSLSCTLFFSKSSILYRYLHSFQRLSLRQNLLRRTNFLKLNNDLRKRSKIPTSLNKLLKIRKWNCKLWNQSKYVDIILFHLGDRKNSSFKH